LQALSCIPRSWWESCPPNRNSSLFYPWR